MSEPAMDSMPAMPQASGAIEQPTQAAAPAQAPQSLLDSAVADQIEHSYGKKGETQPEAAKPEAKAEAEPTVEIDGEKLTHKEIREIRANYKRLQREYTQSQQRLRELEAQPKAEAPANQLPFQIPDDLDPDLHPIAAALGQMVHQAIAPITDRLREAEARELAEQQAQEERALIEGWDSDVEEIAKVSGVDHLKLFHQASLKRVYDPDGLKELAAELAKQNKKPAEFRPVQPVQHRGAPQFHNQPYERDHTLTDPRKIAEMEAYLRGGRR